MNNIESLYISYEPILLEFTEEKVQSRYQNIYQELETFISEYSLTDKLRIDETLLTHAVFDYYTDISRLKKLHQIKNVNEIKVCAYESFWLLRRHPIQITINPAGEEAIVFANEKFFFSKISQFLMQEHVNDEIDPEHRKSIINFFDMLYYYLKYRDCSAQMLEMFLISFKAGIIIGENCANQKRDRVS
ncbi:MAG: hypothetical protein NC429_10615 [Lachnospiraceae bacterium]|nr:hypothetical protein [Lachnospiraceae bacterium]